jgi:hypothetical protein
VNQLWKTREKISSHREILRINIIRLDERMKKDSNFLLLFSDFYFPFISKCFRKIIDFSFVLMWFGELLEIVVSLGVFLVTFLKFFKGLFKL